MRTLAITENMSLDGRVEMLDDWFDPTADQADLRAETTRQSAESDAFLVGRQTFEDLRSFWPQQTDDTTGVTDYLNSVDKFVVSSTLTEPGWVNTTVLAGDPVDEVRELKNWPGKDIVLTGSVTLAHALIDADVVDEFRLFVYPVVQGRGRGLFPSADASRGLRAIGEPQRFGNGVVLLRYAPVR